MVEQFVLWVKCLVFGGVNLIVDVVENVSLELVMKEVICEVEGVIDEVCDEFGKVLVNKYFVFCCLMDVNVKYESLGDQIEMVVKEGCDDFVEVVIFWQMDLESQILVLEVVVSDVDVEEVELESYVEVLQVC